MNAKPNNYNTPVDGDCKNAAPIVSTGQPETKGGYRKKHDLVTLIVRHYLGSSPKNQVRQLGGHKPYQGKRNVDLKMKSELNGSYGRLGNSFMIFYQLTF